MLHHLHPDTFVVRQTNFANNFSHTQIHRKASKHCTECKKNVCRECRPFSSTLRVRRAARSASRAQRSTIEFARFNDAHRASNMCSSTLEALVRRGGTRAAHHARKVRSCTTCDTHKHTRAQLRAHTFLAPMAHTIESEITMHQRAHMLHSCGGALFRGEVVRVLTLQIRPTVTQTTSAPSTQPHTPMQQTT